MNPIDLTIGSQRAVSFASSSPTQCGTEPAAGLPKAASSGFAFAQATKSRTPRTAAGTAGPTAKPKSKRTAREAGAKSATGS